MTITVIPIEPRWFKEKAEVQSITWRQTYEGTLPQDIIEAITPEFALQLTRRHAQGDPGQAVTLVALETDEISGDEHVIGFAEVLRHPREPMNHPEAVELASLYVLADHHRHGAGRALVEAAGNTFNNPKLALWVFDGNANAIAFYQHMGFHFTGATQVEDDGRNAESEMVNY
ncbi:GNAT family N-acetyltransferase [Bifidobacterium oedipodis]|uniref:GNAT family acetyltransferase n=1 Tax=Bifidobacterium oedipodis TaxID=2675322 RepID=A0A7Y0EMM6_9BIFI|nr:GNAT family N-acetyltransferase [Bifidobacterium sp. DSM 109957]NMM93023.1 GNAT family acetyltransferase [Bifidobacterium sp. DSM 109957]